MPNILDRAKSSLDRIAPTRVKNFLHRPLGYGTVFGILMVTGVMTALFWKAHTPEVLEYGEMGLTLMEVKYYDAKLDVSLQNAQVLGKIDSVELLITTSVLREMGMTISNLAMERQLRGLWFPDSLQAIMERQMILRIWRSQNLVRERARFSATLDSVYGNYLDSLSAGKSSARVVLGILSNVRHGEAIPVGAVPPTLKNLMEENLRQLKALQDLRRISMKGIIDETIKVYQVRMAEISRTKERVNMVFYVLSIATVLAVLILLVRLRR